MTIEDDIALLARVPSFAPLGTEALRVLAIGVESHALEQDEVLFREGDAADTGYVIEEGLLTATSRRSGVEEILLGRGALLGELALITETRRPATVRAAEPASVMRIPRALFLRVLEAYPDAAVRLQQAFLERTERLTRDLTGLRASLDVATPPDLSGNDEQKPTD